MPHQNTQSPRATAQNAVTGQTPGNDRGAEQSRSVHPEPRSYAAPDVADSTLAAPAAGEMADYADEGDALGMENVQQGASHTRWPVTTEAKSGQGPKTRAANRKMTKSGSPDQGTF
jgi:hypothetical protein